MASSDNNKGAKITLHWLNKSRSQRIQYLLEELNLTYDLTLYKRGSDKLAPESLKKIHPLGKSPLLTITPPSTSANPEPKPLTIAESGAIVEFLCEHYGTHLIPKRWKSGEEGVVGGETEEWLRNQFFMHYAEGSLMTLLILTIFVDQIRNAPVPFFLKPVTRSIGSKVDDAFLNRNYTSNFGFVEDQLKTAPNGGPYLCGSEITEADFQMFFPLWSVTGEGKLITKEKYPKIVEYVDRLKGREAYKKASERAEKEAGEAFNMDF